MNNGDDDSFLSSQHSDSYSTLSSTSMNIDENFLPDLYSFEESFSSTNIESKLKSDIDLDIVDSMDTIVNNVDSRSDMVLD